MRGASVIALDTNILLRLLLDDDEKQANIARSLVADSPCFVSDTVLLEVSWVLLKSLRMPRSAVYEALLALISSETLNFDNRNSLETTLHRFQQGMDLPDAMHLMRAEAVSATSLATFDQAFIKAAQTAQTPIPVTHPK
jgi:predicted nucleic-acid-binding protein